MFNLIVKKYKLKHITQITIFIYFDKYIKFSKSKLLKKLKNQYKQTAEYSSFPKLEFAF